MSGADPMPQLGSTQSASLWRRASVLQLALLGCLVTFALWLSPPGIFSDSVSGFYVMRSMERGAAWNHRLLVDEADIARDRSEFVSWWTPGQYAVPMLFRPLGLDLGGCMIATTWLAWLAGLAGYLRLFEALAVPESARLPSLAVLASQPYVLGWASFYHGGELLQWSWFPWCALLLLRRRSLRWRDVPLAAGALILGLFLKSSFAIPAAALLATLGFLRLAEAGFAPSLPLLAWAGRALVVAAVAGLAFVAYVAAGRSPASEAGLAGSAAWLEGLLFAGAAPLSSLFEAWRLYIPESEETIWPFAGLHGLLAVAALGSLALLIALLRRVALGREYRALLACTYLVFVAAYAVAHALELRISFNVRHYRLAGLLFVPGLVTGILRLRRPAARSLLATSVAGACLLAAGAFGWSVLHPRSERVVGREGFSQIYAGADVIDLLQALDGELATGNNLIGVPWPQLGFEVERNRVLDMRTAVEGHAYFEQKAWRGRVDDLVILVPVEDVRSGKSRLVTGAFEDQRGWRRIHRDIEGYWVLHSGSHAGFPP